MSTIQTKRKKSTGNANVTLVAAEPYYNLVDKALYLGDADGTNTFEGKKHIAELSVSSDTARQLKLAIGEAIGNEVTLKVAHTDGTHAEGVEVSDKAITLYVDSYTKQEIRDTNDTIANEVDGKIETATELHLNKLADNTSSLQVGSTTDNSFKIALNHSLPTSPNLEGVFWSESDNILYITVSAYNKSEIDTKFTDAKQELNDRISGVENKVDEVSADLSANYYTTDYTYSKTEVDSEIATETDITVSTTEDSDGKMAKVQIGSNPSNYYQLLVSDGGVGNDWTTTENKISLNMKPYYTTTQIDDKFKAGIAGQMQVVDGVLKFGKSGT